MSLLQRLAARALGAEAALRPHRPAWGADAAVAPAAPEWPTAATEPVHIAPRPDPSTVSAPPERMPMAPPARPASAGVPPAQRSSIVPPSQAANPTRPADGPRHEAAAPAVPQALTAWPTETPAARPADALPAWPASPLPRAGIAPPLLPPRALSPVRPVPLLAPRPAEAAAVSRRARAAAPAAPTEVHVSIGRVELIAPPAARPAGAAAPGGRRAAESSSLADYLRGPPVRGSRPA